MALGHLSLRFVWMLKGRRNEVDPCGPPQREWDLGGGVG